MTDILGKPLDFAHGRGLEMNKGVVCTTPDLHATVIEAISELAPPAE